MCYARLSRNSGRDCEAHRMPRVARLREVREKKILTQRELGEKAGVATSRIIKLGQGKAIVHPRTIRKLAEALGVEPAKLVE